MLQEEQWKCIDRCLYCGAKLMEMGDGRRVVDDEELDCWHHFPEHGIFSRTSEDTDE